tara:strand:+ start:323 stop:583 length:261 start_codon:yes stop_codon:yes gene_type:complete
MGKIAKLKTLHEEGLDLLAQLQRQLSFEEEFGVAPHQIKSITLVPKGRDSEGFILHRSRVVLKSGEVRDFPFNVKAVLDGAEYLIQ